MGLRWLPPILLAWALAAATAAGQAVVFDFTNDTWDHSAVGGPTGIGWTSGLFGGTSTDASGLSVTISYEAVGAAVRVPGSLGTTAVGAETVLRGNVNTDYNAVALNNYVIFRVKYSQVVLPGNIRIYDLDEDQNLDDPLRPNWQDFVTARFYHNGILQTGPVNYTTTSSNQQIANHLGQDGFMGINQVNTSGTAGDAFVMPTVGYDEVELIFTQGPEGIVGGSHLIGLYALTVVAVPEPGALALLLAGGAALLGWRRLRR